MDRWTKEKRSEVMSLIRSRNTKPEIKVRRLLHLLGFRFTVNGPRNRSLPGKPDLVLPKYRAAIFVHGCFWHRHNCKVASNPKSRKAYWRKKFAANVARDRRVQASLRKLGWKVIVVWECRTRSRDLEPLAQWLVPRIMV